MRIVKFQASHLAALELQEAQKYFHADCGGPDYGQALAASPFSFSAVEGKRVIGCAGVHEVWAGRAVAWALLSKDAGPHFRTIHRAAKGFIEQAPWRRIEMMVEGGFAAGHRWAKLLGFACETPAGMPGYSPTGVDFYLYSRVK